ncbi:MAG TPA: UbiX family flavin prenyltransferase [Acidimicrobiia bacterium]|nr:UbiX family flavin prenyltransferase [Acidimicrobiia bacterium]
MNVRRLIVAMTGSSAPHLGEALLEALSAIGDVETHLVISAGARKTIELELGKDPTELESLGDVLYQPDDLAAAVSSGSFTTMGMVIVPCSMRTLAAIASGNTTDLVSRAADVCLKERRRLVLVPRETPLNLIHIRNMETVTLAGATVLPPVPAFYHKPKTIRDLLDHTAGKILDQFEVHHDLYQRWA